MKILPSLLLLALLTGAGCTPNNATSSTTTVAPVKIFFVALSDDGASGKKIGCGDSVVSVEKQLPPSSLTPPLMDALSALLAEKNQYYGQSGLYNSLAASNLQVKKITYVNGAYTVKLTGTIGLGGSCDSPRVYSQIMETVLQFPEVKTATVFIDDKKLEDALSTK